MSNTKKYNDVKIIIIDDDKKLNQDNVNIIFGDLKEKTNFLQITMNLGTNEIINDLKNKMSEKNNCYIVLLDTELHRKSMTKNDEYVNAVLNYLLKQENVYIMLYTGVDPDACRWLYNAIKNLKGKDSFKAKLFYMPLDLYFFHNPTNYRYFVNEQLRREFQVLKTGSREENWINLG